MYNKEPEKEADLGWKLDVLLLSIIDLNLDKFSSLLNSVIPLLLIFEGNLGKSSLISPSNSLNHIGILSNLSSSKNNEATP